jgi:hypothetical protein
MKKEETFITLANGGMHSQTNYRKCKDMIRDNTYAMARLYHLVFKGSSNKEAYLAALNALCEEMRNNNIPCKWKACFEMDEGKGLHLHAFILLDAKHGRPDYFIRYAEDGWLVLMLKALGLTFNISRPRNKIHRTATGKKQNYAYITKTGPKLEDALIWCSYLYKVRSKDDSMKTIYHSSRERVAKKKPASDSPAALPAAKEAIPETKTDGDEMQLTEAVFRYLATQYETCVDRGMNVVEIQSYLSNKGISRSLHQIKHELNNVFCFPGYVDAHPAPAMPDHVEFDAGMNRTPVSASRLDVVSISAGESCHALLHSLRPVQQAVLSRASH